MKKKIFVVGIILLLATCLISTLVSLASNDILYVGINRSFKDNIGYSIGNPNSSGKNLWNLRNYDSDNKEDESIQQRQLYCLKGEYGVSWESNIDNIVEYNLSYDLQEDREKLLQLLGNSTTGTPNNIVAQILNPNGYYRELLWVLDNSYIPGQSDKNQLLQKIGILYSDIKAVINNILFQKKG